VSANRTMGGNFDFDPCEPLEREPGVSERGRRKEWFGSETLAVRAKEENGWRGGNPKPANKERKGKGANMPAGK